GEVEGGGGGGGGGGWGGGGWLLLRGSPLWGGNGAPPLPSGSLCTMPTPTSAARSSTGSTCPARAADISASATSVVGVLRPRAERRPTVDDHRRAQAAMQQRWQHRVGCQHQTEVAHHHQRHQRPVAREQRCQPRE